MNTSNEYEGFRQIDGKEIILTGVTKIGKTFIINNGALVRLMGVNEDEMRIQNPNSNSPMDTGFWSAWVKLSDFTFIYR